METTAHAPPNVSSLVQAKMAEEVLEDEEDLDEDDILARRLDAGLFVLQQCTLIVGNLWLMGDAGVKRHIVDILHQKVGGGNLVQPVLSLLQEAA